MLDYDNWRGTCNDTNCSLNTGRKCGRPLDPPCQQEEEFFRCDECDQLFPIEERTIVHGKHTGAKFQYCQGCK